MVDRERVRGVVLAGGDSTRFAGGDKALADLDSRPLLAHVVAALAAATAGTPLLAVATEREGERLAAALADADGAGGDRSVDPVVDVHTHAGPAAGLFAAVEAADRPWLFVCGCDMPLVTADGIEALRRAGDPGAAAVVPTVDGHPQPLYALYRRERVAAVREDLHREAGPVALLDALDGVQRVPADSLDAPVERAVANVNTRDDLGRVRDRLDGSR